VYTEISMAADADLDEPWELISARVYAAIFAEPELKRQLLPEGVLTSPYEVLRFDGVLDLMDAQGREARFARTQEIRFLQDGVAGLLDHYWSEGIGLASYHTTAGTLGPLIRDGQRRHLVTELPRPMRRGEILRFSTERTMHGAFTHAVGTFDVLIDHPIQALSLWVLFPKERPCEAALLLESDSVTPLAVESLPGGRTVVRVVVPHPRANHCYTVAWHW
jgi:hypothetical protein